jgi:excisionase family DNA binding protein
MTEQPYLTVTEVCTLTGLNRDTVRESVRELFDSGQLSGYTLPSGHRRIARQSVKALMGEIR